MWCGRWLVASEPDVVNHTELKGAADEKFMNKFSLIIYYAIRSAIGMKVLNNSFSLSMMSLLGLAKVFHEIMNNSIS